MKITPAVFYNGQSNGNEKGRILSRKTFLALLLQRRWGCPNDMVADWQEKAFWPASLLRITLELIIKLVKAKSTNPIPSGEDQSFHFSLPSLESLASPFMWEASSGPKKVMRRCIQLEIIWLLFPGQSWLIEGAFFSFLPDPAAKWYKLWLPLLNTHLSYLYYI